MAKSADAFRTISEVADWLGIPAHVLRFWESKFTQVKPVKRAGGRRYYRPADMQLLGGIRKLLHEDGMTIKGVQKILREQGVKEVVALSPPLDTDTSVGEEISGIALNVSAEPASPKGQVLSFGRDTSAAPEPAPQVSSQPTEEEPPEPEEEDQASGDDPATDVVTAPPERSADAPADTPPARAASDAETGPDTDAEPDTLSLDTSPADAPQPAERGGMPSFLQKSLDERQKGVDQTAHATAEDPPDEPEVESGTPPSETATEETPPESDAVDETQKAEATPAPPRVTPITTPPDPSDDAPDGPEAAIGPLTALAGLPAPSADQRTELAAIADRLRLLQSGAGSSAGT